MNRSPRRTTPSHTPAPPAITRIGMLALTRSSVRCWKAHATRWKNASRSAKTPMAVKRTEANQGESPERCDFCIVVVATSVAAGRVETTTEFVASTGGLLSTMATCTRTDRSTSRGRCSRGKRSRCRRNVDTPDGVYHRSRLRSCQRQISEVIERACADPEDQARGRALDDPFHQHPQLGGGPVHTR